MLERVGFDKAVERGGVKKALAKSQYDASSILAKLGFYVLMLFVLQLAFGIFGTNPVSDLITGVIAYLPNIFVAILILVVASAIAAAVKEIVEASLGGLSYGKALAVGSWRSSESASLRPWTSFRSLRPSSTRCSRGLSSSWSARVSLRSVGAASAP